MGSALYDHVQSIACIGADAGIISGTVLSRLRVYGSDDYGNRFIEPLESFVFRRRIRIVEFARAVANVAGLCDLRADVVFQIACEMQHQVAEAISEGKGLCQNLVFA